MISGIYYANTVSETALINLNVLSNLNSLDQYQRLVIINMIYHANTVSETALINSGQKQP